MTTTSEPQDIAALRETAEVGDLLHDAGSRQDEGWFILGDDGYLDVDNATWCAFDPDDAPWTSEHFVIYSPVLALLSDLDAERERGRALRAAVEMLAEEFHEVAQSITNLDAASLGRQSVWQSCSRQTRALLATPVPSPLAEVRDDRERRGGGR